MKRIYLEKQAKYKCIHHIYSISIWNY